MYKTKSAYSQIGEVSYCPNCSEEFPPTTLYETVRYAIYVVWSACDDVFGELSAERWGEIKEGKEE